MTDLLNSLTRAVHGVVRSDAAEILRVDHDASHLTGHALAVVAPRDPDDVVALVRWAREHGVPLVPRGAGTSLDGESVPMAGGVVVDLSGWNRVMEILEDERLARVGPGTVNRDLQAALAPHGLFFPPNPGSWTVSTIGGHVGTNASGPRSFRYGPTRSWVRSLEAVLGTGERVGWGGRAAKRAVGPDLLSLFVGSEGTLGITTEVTVRLAPLPAIREALVVDLPDGGPLAPVAAALARARGTGLAAVEYLDRACAAELAGPQGFDHRRDGPLLLLEIEAEDLTEARARRERVGEVLRRVGVVTEPTVYDDADVLWTLRGRAGVALDERLGHRIREDVAVPLAAIDPLVVELERISALEHVPLYLFGHLGEGNLHPNYAVDPESSSGLRVRAAVLAASSALGGTISAEHGIGAIKAPFLEREIGTPGVEVLRALKRVCDPDGILNPGKLYPSPRE
ncbi:MAG: FAD-binding oxidoreductase [Thermoplasmata archaeon]|nr:FAD-binding oxidoreductase [Thermoplasmata archaeon]